MFATRLARLSLLISSFIVSACGGNYGTTVNPPPPTTIIINPQMVSVEVTTTTTPGTLASVSVFDVNYLGPMAVTATTTAQAGQISTPCAYANLIQGPQQNVGSFFYQVGANVHGTCSLTFTDNRGFYATLIVNGL